MFSVLRKHLNLLILWGVIVAVLAGAISFVFPLQYSAVSQVLIISRDRAGVDPYTQAKSAERIGENLAEVIKTTDFYDKVMESTAVSFDKDKWKNYSERQQRKNWQRDVKPETVYGTSLLKVTTYATTPDEVKNFCNAVVQTLTSRGWEYIGGDVVLKQVDNPLVSMFPNRPNVVANFLAGFVIGFLLSALWILKYRRHTHFGRI
ncbi:MAG: Wzz/FepE/Etk N-terminal domain-containing protein [Patescibacteria group bacterium]|jgi:capsular polysaccharide biosynthesis protein